MTVFYAKPLVLKQIKLEQIKPLETNNELVNGRIIN